ncbi:MAG: citrate/2-methylcitrate synthase [Pseudomonadota bacterium]
MNAPQHIDTGLEGIVVGTTAVSDVDGSAGRLSYRGAAIETLVEHPFAEVATLVLLDRPDLSTAPVRAFIDGAVELTNAETARVLALPRTLHPMHMLQSMIPTLDRQHDQPALDTALLSAIDPGRSIPAALPMEFAHGLSIARKLPLLVATHRAGMALRPAGSSYAERFLDAIDAPRQPGLAQAFEVMQILQLEHSFNASTFAARVIASTEAPIENALAGAIGTLHGRLHGGADQAALETADAVGTPENARAFVDRCLEEKRKVMGMGHREYRVLDPRARFAKALAEKLTRGGPHEQTFKTLEAIEARFNDRMAQRGKALYANIEFYKGVIFRSLGLEPSCFTALFAMARAFGYLAHVLESRFDGRLIRPAANYRPRTD